MMPAQWRRLMTVGMLTGAIGLLWASDTVTDVPPPFSAQPSGTAIAPPWRVLTVPKIAANDLALVSDGGVTVLKVTSRASAGSLAAQWRIETQSSPLLRWRWRVDRVVEKADMTSKTGDDFAARVYVFFDVPLDTVPFVDRFKIRLAKALYGAELPTAAICYVWDNTHPPGEAIWSPYTNRVRVVVLQSGNQRAGQWVAEARDPAADFKAAFGFAAPAITGIALGADTDQTGEAVTAFFGDVTVGSRP